jgi:hypothetical protein
MEGQSMFNMSRVFHTGIIVADIEKAQAEIGASLNLEWTEIKEFTLAHWIPETGLKEITMRAAYSKQGPHHLELCEGPAGSLYDLSRSPDGRHIGVWVDDLVSETQRLLAQGWHIEAANGTPEEGYGVLTYMSPPASAFVVELVDWALKPMIDEWVGPQA